MADNGQNVIRVCAQADVPPGTVKAFAVGSNALAVYNIDARTTSPTTSALTRPRASPTACSRAT